MGYLDHEKDLNVSGYTYDPSKMELKDRLRLELGDTDVSFGSKSAVFSDVELEAFIKATKGKSYRHTKIMAIEAMLAKFAQEVDFSIDGMSYSLSQRIKYWQDQLKILKKTAGSPPSTIFGKNVNAFGANQNTNHYFTTNMLTNPKRTPDED